MSGVPDLDIVAIGPGLREVLLSTDEVVPVTTWFDNGEQVGPGDHVTHIVAGPSADGRWVMTTLRNFDSSIPNH